MNDSLSIRGRFLKGERIIITSGKHQFLAFALFLGGLFFLIGSICMCINIYKFEIFTFLLITISISILSILLFYYSILLVDLGMKKNTLYISHFFTCSRIIDIEQIGKICKVSILGLHFVYVHYRCEGKQRKSLFIKNSKRESLKKLQLMLDEYEKMKSEPIRSDVSLERK